MAVASHPRVSVIMPVRDAGAFLGSAIASVQAQSLTAWELLAVDDGSDDDSAAILGQAAAADGRIRLLDSGGRLGPAAARNVALAAARGRYLAFLDADDLWHPDKLARQTQAMAATGAALSCTAWLRRNIVSGREVVVGVPARATRGDLLKTNTIACSTAMIDARAFGQRRMPGLRRAEDFAFWLDLLTATPWALGLPEVLTTYRQHPRALSAHKGRAAADTWALYRHALHLPLPDALWYFGHYALRGTLRHRAPAVARAMGWLHGAKPHRDATVCTPSQAQSSRCRAGSSAVTSAHRGH
ncbi:MAG: glycosyltransferase family 2 protein [Rubellimicrobium sp.]|nr:glycosyltransferase family 2 protein [Rubellimicrobium sp.]